MKFSEINRIVRDVPFVTDDNARELHVAD